jgi:hypothetical protein
LHHSRIERPAAAVCPSGLLPPSDSLKRKAHDAVFASQGDELGAFASLRLLERLGLELLVWNMGT